MSNIPALKPVASSMIIEAGYNSNTRELFVRFSGGKLYSYADVPQSEYENMIAADSAGKYLNSNIKPVYSATLVS